MRAKYFGGKNAEHKFFGQLFVINEHFIFVLYNLRVPASNYVASKLQAKTCNCKDRFTRVNVLTKSVPPGGINATWKKQERNLVTKRNVINCQYFCDSWIFSLRLMDFVSIFPFICQFWRFLHNCIQNVEHFLAFRVILKIFLNNCV